MSMSRLIRDCSIPREILDLEQIFSHFRSSIVFLAMHGVEHYIEKSYEVAVGLPFMLRIPLIW